jgi:hypothetical protein
MGKLILRGSLIFEIYPVLSMFATPKDVLILVHKYGCKLIFSQYKIK